MTKTEDTVTLMQSLIKDLEALIKEMEGDYENIIYDLKRTINFLETENEILKKERSE